MYDSLEPFSDDSKGPLQTQVASPDFTDWQNIDWSVLTPFNEGVVSPGGSSGILPEIGGDDLLYGICPNYVSSSLPQILTLAVDLFKLVSVG
jgi:hypothetical protein